MQNILHVWQLVSCGTKTKIATTTTTTNKIVQIVMKSYWICLKCAPKNSEKIFIGKYTRSGNYPLGWDTKKTKKNRIFLCWMQGWNEGITSIFFYEQIESEKMLTKIVCFFFLVFLPFYWSFTLASPLILTIFLSLSLLALMLSLLRFNSFSLLPKKYFQSKDRKR